MTTAGKDSMCVADGANGGDPFAGDASDGSKKGCPENGRDIEMILGPSALERSPDGVANHRDTPFIGENISVLLDTAACQKVQQCQTNTLRTWWNYSV